MILTRKNLWFMFGLFVALSNMLLYRTSFGSSIIPSDTNGMVIGSLLDFVIVVPLAIIFTQGKFSLKKFILYSGLGCVAIRFIIPMEYLDGFVFVTWAGLALEGAVLIAELYLIITIMRHLPKILGYVKESRLPVVFAVQEGIGKYIRPHLLVQVIFSELVMFYYAIATWRKSSSVGVTLYKNTSYVAMQIMIIHAIIFETIGIHWWLHDVSPIVSFILLIFNIYSVFFFLGDLQAMRLTPVLFEDHYLYISYGLMKKAKIRYDDIDEIIMDRGILEQKLSKKTLSFIVSEFEEVHPQFILKMKEPVIATYYMGIQKKYDEVAIRVDDSTRFLQQLQQKMK